MYYLYPITYEIIITTCFFYFRHERTNDHPYLPLHPTNPKAKISIIIEIFFKEMIFLLTKSKNIFN
jgi:hypothetical protein